MEKKKKKNSFNGTVFISFFHSLSKIKSDKFMCISAPRCNLLPPTQSAFRSFHSNGTSLLKIWNDFFFSLNYLVSLLLSSLYTNCLSKRSVFKICNFMFKINIITHLATKLIFLSCFFVRTSTYSNFLRMPSNNTFAKSVFFYCALFYRTFFSQFFLFHFFLKIFFFGSFSL